MGKLISFAHISLDGFVAGPSGEMNWIKVSEDLFDHIGARIGNTNTALYGRVTYDMMEAYWPDASEGPDAGRHEKTHAAWYNRVRKIVVSRTMQGMQLPRTAIVGQHLADEIREIKKSEDREILLFGSPTTTHALAGMDLIDGYWLFVNPVILGRGIPLFKNENTRVDLKLTGPARQFGTGVTELDYVVDRS